MADNPLHIQKNHAVLLRNKFFNEYLVRYGTYDYQRIHVSIAKDIVTNRKVNVGVSIPKLSASASTAFSLNYASEDAKWRLKYNGYGAYEIIHRAYNEPLIADEGTYDFERRYVYTWNRGPSKKNGFWIFEKQSNGYFKIKNTHYEEYLYAAAYPKKGWIFTWRYAKNVGDDMDKFYWEIVED